MGQCLSTEDSEARQARVGRLPSSAEVGTLKTENGAAAAAAGPGQVRIQMKGKDRGQLPVVPKPKDGFIVRGLYDFGKVSEDDLSFKKGDRMLVDESTREMDWLLATHMKTGEKGYIPSNYVCADDNSPQAQEWWFDSDRKEADLVLLLPGNSNGTFLVREAHDKKSYVLSVRQEVPSTGDPSVRHYRVKKMDDGGHYISPKKQFQDIFSLIQYYSEEVESGLCTKLSHPCPRLKPLQLGFKDLEMKRQNLQLQSKLGHGHFGEVWKAKLSNSVVVAVKTLKKGTMSPEDFLREAEIMHKLRHRKLVNLLGVCSKEEPVYIVTEFMAHGALLDFLHKDDTPKTVRFPVLVKMAAQVADGMHYLEKNNFVHRDLRAANILVGEHYDVKVADFGLARILHDDIYDASENAKFPIKWTAPEAGLQRKFTVKSDVWSFGIVLYELFTYGRVPYPGLTGNVLLKVEGGYRMPNPASSNIVCPDPVYDIMTKCWRHHPADRPTFEFLKDFFEDYEVSAERQYCEQ